MTEHITIDRYGLDEIVLQNVDVHLERMDAHTIWIGISRPGAPVEHRLSVSLVAKSNVLRASLNENEIGVQATPKSAG